jgi:ubiquinone/menaquinone biosynthesis C-methylase UbiE
MAIFEYSPYLRLIQKTGNTKHPGGFFATDTLLKRTKLTKNSRLLDVGCGAGFSSAHIVKNYGCNVVGVDISPDVLEQARTLHEHEPYFERMRLQKAEANNLPFSDGYFDVVLCESVLFFILDKDAVMAEMARVVKPDGYIAINEICIKAQPGLQKIKDYFLRPEFGGFLSTSQKLCGLLDKNEWSILLQDEKPFDIKKEMFSILRQAFNKKSLLKVLEFFYQTAIDHEVRNDFFHMIKFILNMPQGTWRNLNSLLLLAKKTSGREQ